MFAVGRKAWRMNANFYEAKQPRNNRQTTVTRVKVIIREKILIYGNPQVLLLLLFQFLIFRRAKH
jgi:hypothetical protein